MTADTHGNPLRHSGAYHVADCRPAEVVKQSAPVLQVVVFKLLPSAFRAWVSGARWFRTAATQHPAKASDATCRLPCLTEISHREAVSMENQPSQHHSVALLYLPGSLAALDQLCQFALQRHRSTFAILRVLRPQPDNISVQIIPAERCNLALAPAGQIAEVGEIVKVFWQVLPNGAKLGIREKTLPRIASLRKMADDRRGGQASALNCQLERLRQQLRRAVYCRRSFRAFL